MQYGWWDHPIDIHLRSTTCCGFQKIYLIISSKRRWHPNFLPWIPFYTMRRKRKKLLSRRSDIGVKGGIDRHQIMRPKILQHENCTVKATPHVTRMATINFNRNLNGRMTGNRYLNSPTIVRNHTNRCDRRRRAIYRRIRRIRNMVDGQECPQKTILRKGRNVSTAGVRTT